MLQKLRKINETTYKESPFKSIIQDIKRCLYYVEKMNNLSTSDIKKIKEKLFNNNNNKITKYLNEYKGIKYIRYLFNEIAFNEDKNKKLIFIWLKKMKKKIASEIKVKEGLNEYNGIKDIRYYFFNDNVYKDIKDIRYLCNEDYYIENIKCEFEKIFNNFVEVHNKDVRYMVDYINNGEYLKEIPIDLEDVNNKFIAYSDTLPFGILST